MLYRDQKLGSGSGFFWKLDDRTFLISNWHNFSDLNPETGLAILSTAGRPDRITFTSYKQLSDSDADGFFELSLATVTVPLYDSDLSGPRWLHHPKFGRKVDIAAIDVSQAVTGLKVDHVNVVESDAVLQPFASQDVFIVGYPLGLILGFLGYLPSSKLKVAGSNPAGVAISNFCLWSCLSFFALWQTGYGAGDC